MNSNTSINRDMPAASGGAVRFSDGLERCAWLVPNDPLYRLYHDTEWGVPLHDDRALFELLVLEGFQAGLSWRTVLHKRERFRQVFDQFDAGLVANYGAAKVEELMADAGIIRNRLKIGSAISNAQRFLKLQQQHGSFSSYLWAFVEGEPVVNHWQAGADVPSRTELSDILSRDLRTHGFKFVGSTIMYAYLQAAGLVQDHLQDCYRHAQLR
jgi:DNA-3-methyladenine glycosylase I